MTMQMAIFTALGLLSVAASSLIMLHLFEKADAKARLKGSKQ
jgi:hypothetical protein